MGEKDPQECTKQTVCIKLSQLTQKKIVDTGLLRHFSKAV